MLLTHAAAHVPNTHTHTHSHTSFSYLGVCVCVCVLCCSARLGVAVLLSQLLSSRGERVYIDWWRRRSMERRRRRRRGNSFRKHVHNSTNLNFFNEHKQKSHVRRAVGGGSQEVLPRACQPIGEELELKLNLSDQSSSIIVWGGFKIHPRTAITTSTHT